MGDCLFLHDWARFAGCEGWVENYCATPEQAAGVAGRDRRRAGLKLRCKAVVTPQCDRGHGRAVTAKVLIEIEFQFHNVQFRDECPTSESTFPETTASPVFPLAANRRRPAGQPGPGRFERDKFQRAANRFVFLRPSSCSRRSDPGSAASAHANLELPHAGDHHAARLSLVLCQLFRPEQPVHHG